MTNTVITLRILVITDTEIDRLNSSPARLSTKADIASLTPSPPGTKLINPKIKADEIANKTIGKLMWLPVANTKQYMSNAPNNQIEAVKIKLEMARCILNASIKCPKKLRKKSIFCKNMAPVRDTMPATRPKTRNLLALPNLVAIRS